jgi:hypothetical protein
MRRGDKKKKAAWWGESLQSHYAEMSLNATRRLLYLLQDIVGESPMKNFSSFF